MNNKYAQRAEYQSDQARQRAAKAFEYYMNLLCENSNVRGATDEMRAEWQGIIDDLVEAGAKMATAMWVEMASDFQQYLIKVGCSCAAEKLVDEWLEGDAPSGDHPMVTAEPPSDPVGLPNMVCRDCGTWMDTGNDEWTCPECGLHLRLVSDHPEC